jgi:ornithine cyclodeaminase
LLPAGRHCTCPFIDRDEVARRLTYDLSIPIVRDAMIAFSRGETKQLLRSIPPLSEGRLFGAMPGALGTHAPFGAG